MSESKREVPLIIRAIALLAIIGFAVGMISALFDSRAWIVAGAAIFIWGSLIVWAYTVWKRPQAVDSLSVEEATPEEEPPINVATATQELRRKDRGGAVKAK